MWLIESSMHRRDSRASVRDSFILLVFRLQAKFPSRFSQVFQSWGPPRLRVWRYKFAHSNLFSDSVNSSWCQHFKTEALYPLEIRFQIRRSVLPTQRILTQRKTFSAKLNAVFTRMGGTEGFSVVLADKRTETSLI